MKAAICYEFSAPLKVEDVSLDQPGPGEVKIRVATTAICHSDVSALHGDWGGRLPMVAGHETAGIVEEAGERVTSVKPGDRVVVSLLRACGRCFYCLSGAPNQCIGTFASDSETHLRTSGGEPLARRFGTASFAEYTVVDESQVVRIPDAIPLDRASLLACGVLTGVGAVVHTARVEAGATVVVIGTGGVGLNAVQGARLAGARRIIALDLLDSKLAVAEIFGATHTLNAGRDDVRKQILDMADGRGADYV
ncbi:MAG: alcohol dehydrogenase catalytic domain-containing protein, partial [Ktedonobacterales bacterium]